MKIVSKNVDFVGVWTSPGNDKKKYSDGYSSISWRKSKKVLEIEGRDRNLITAKLCTMLCNDFDPVQSSKSDNYCEFPSTSNEMLVELEGVKLDVTITEKDIRDNKHSIKNVEDCLDKVVGKLNIINQQFDVFRAEFQLLKNQHTIQYSPKAVEYSNLDNQNASGLQKRHEENNNIIGSNLNDDIVMSRNDALQSLANLRSECLPNVCYDTQLKRLEREPHDEQDKTKQLESELTVAETKILQLEQALNLHELEQKSKETDNRLCHDHSCIIMESLSTNCIRNQHAPSTQENTCTNKYITSQELIPNPRIPPKQVDKQEPQKHAGQVSQFPKYTEISDKNSNDNAKRHKPSQHTRKDTRKQDDYVNSTNYENPFVLTKLSITDESNTEECFSLSNENAIVSSQTENSSLNLDLPIKDLIHAHSQEENTTSSSAVIMRNPTNWLNYLPFCEVPLPKHEKLSNFQSDKINPQLSDCCPLSTPPSEKIDVKKREANKGKLSFPSRKNKICTKKSERHHSDRSPFHRRPTNHAPVMYHPNSLPPYQIHQLRKLHIPSYQPHRLNISPPYLPPCQKELPPYYPSPPMRSREWLDYLDIVHQVTRIL